MKLVHRLAVRSCALIVASGLLTISPAGAEPSLHDHSPTGTLRFGCSSPTANLDLVGSESTGYQAIVRVATVGSTKYYAGTSFGSTVAAEVTYERGHLIARIPVRTAPFPSEPIVGMLTLSADLVVGRMQVVKSGGGQDSGAANEQTVSVSKYRRLVPDGDVHLVAPDGAEALVGGCAGVVSMGASSVSSDPHATVEAESHAEGTCAPITVDGQTYSLFVQAATTPPETAQLVLVRPDGEWDTYYVGDAGDGSGLASWGRGVSFDLTGFQGAVGATANVRFVADESSSFSVYSGTWTDRIDATIGRVTGTLAFPDGAIAPVSCDAYSADDRFIQAGGAPSTSSVPRNDLPAGALLLTVGAQATVNTAGAASGVEAPFECLTYEDGRSAATNTVWYTVTGAGPLTIDTAGTRFDSAVAVYTEDGAGGFTPVPETCVDDTWTAFGPILLVLNLQASVTFNAEPGVTYFVQIAGTDADRNVGTLRVVAR